MAIVGGTVSDMNGINKTGFYTGYNNPKGAPTSHDGMHWHVIHMQYMSGWKAQIATSFGDGPVYKRVMFEGVWEPWLKL